MVPLVLPEVKVGIWHSHHLWTTCVFPHLNAFQGEKENGDADRHSPIPLLSPQISTNNAWPMYFRMVAVEALEVRLTDLIIVSNFLGAIASLSYNNHYFTKCCWITPQCHHLKWETGLWQVPVACTQSQKEATVIWHKAWAKPLLFLRDMGTGQLNISFWLLSCSTKNKSVLLKIYSNCIIIVVKQEMIFQKWGIKSFLLN